MNLLEKVGLALIHIPADVREIGTKVANATTALENDLKSGAAIESASLIDTVLPNGIAETVREAAIKVCDAAIAGCKALQGISDTAGLSGRLKRLGSDLTQLAHDDDQHTFSFYDECFETIYNDLFGKAA